MFHKYVPGVWSIDTNPQFQSTSLIPGPSSMNKNQLVFELLNVSPCPQLVANITCLPFSDEQVVHSRCRWSSLKTAASHSWSRWLEWRKWTKTVSWKIVKCSIELQRGSISTTKPFHVNHLVHCYHYLLIIIHSWCTNLLASFLIIWLR